MANTSLTRTSGTSTNVDKCTFSAWIKRGALSSSDFILMGQYTDANNRGKILISDNQLSYFEKTGGSTTASLLTTRRFRDISSWYHIVVAFDSTQGTATDRVKFYVNGVQETVFSNTDYVPQDGNIRLNESSVPIFIGQDGNSGYYFDGIMSHVHFVDGTAYAPTAFGETDATTGEWKIKTNVSVTYGTNGFFILKDGNSVTDQSGNSNNFTASCTLTNTEDCPSNNFATFNTLWRARVNTGEVGEHMSNGNLTFFSEAPDSDLIYFASTIGVTSGKYYWEVQSYDGTGGAVGVCYNSMQSNTNNQFWDNSDLLGLAIKINGNNLNGKSGDGGGALGVTYSPGDIYGFALDMDNYAVYVHINGTYVNSGSPTSGASKTGSLLGLLTSGTAYLNSGEPVFPFFADLSTNAHAGLKANFGNGYFGTTAISSEGTNASGIGKFEYDVPAGYTALSTKGLNE